MIIDVSKSGVVDVYRALVSIVTPRPIAWVSTIDAEGRPNLAPYSFYNAFGANPPVVVFSPTTRRDGTVKDTLNNVRATGEFVLNAAVEPLAEALNLTSKEIPPGQSEADLAGLTLAPSRFVRPPRVVESPIQMECRLYQIVSIGSGPIAPNLVIGEVVLIEISESVLDAEGRVDPRKLRTIGRMGGDDYCRTSDLFPMPRP